MDNLKFCPKPSGFVPTEEMVLTLWDYVQFIPGIKTQSLEWKCGFAKEKCHGLILIKMKILG